MKFQKELVNKMVEIDVQKELKQLEKKKQQIQQQIIALNAIESFLKEKLEK